MSNCIKCHDTGYITDGNNKFVAYCDCIAGQQLKQKIREQKFLEAGIQRAYWSLTFKDFQPQVQHIKHVQFTRDVEAYMKNIHKHRQDGTLWLIYGDVGVGKTLAASLILKEALKKDYTCLYIIWTDLVDGNIVDDELIEKLRSVDFLVIDDLGKDKLNINSTSQYAQDLLEKIIKPRYGNKMPTILVSSRDYRDLVVKFPVLSAMLSPQWISEVVGVNFRPNARNS